MMSARFAGDAFQPAAWRVFGIVSDGDVMEGVASEAASLAGHWGLGNLVYLYDDNRITIEGETSLAMSEDVALRFEAYGWHVDRADPYDRAALAAAIERAIAERERPSLVITRSHIGYGAPHKQDTREAHGEPLGGDELLAAKRALGYAASRPLSDTLHCASTIPYQFSTQTRAGAAARASFHACAKAVVRWSKTSAGSSPSATTSHPHRAPG
jgi:transketolase